MRDHILGGVMVGAALTIGFACGGNVVVDPDGAGGAGGAGGITTTVTTSMNGVGGTGALCPVPVPPGPVVNCGGTVSTGSGAPIQCDTTWCDETGENNIYSASCTAQACTCQYNFQTACSCAIDAGDICAGTAAPCCPFPFPL